MLTDALPLGCALVPDRPKVAPACEVSDANVAGAGSWSVVGGGGNVIIGNGGTVEVDAVLLMPAVLNALIMAFVGIALPVCGSISNPGGGVV